MVCALAALCAVFSPPPLPSFLHLPHSLRQKDNKDGRYTQVVSNVLDTKMRDDLERLKKIRNHRGLRHYWGVRVRGQHTKTTGRKGKVLGMPGGAGAAKQ